MSKAGWRRPGCARPAGSALGSLNLATRSFLAVRCSQIVWWACTSKVLTRDRSLRACRRGLGAGIPSYFAGLGVGGSSSSWAPWQICKGCEVPLWNVSCFPLCVRCAVRSISFIKMFRSRTYDCTGFCFLRTCQRISLQCLAPGTN